MKVAVAPFVAEARRMYAELAEQENVSVETIIDRQYRSLRIVGPLAEIEAHVKRGNLPESLRVNEWTPDAANYMLAIATVVLAAA